MCDSRDGKERGIAGSSGVVGVELGTDFTPWHVHLCKEDGQARLCVGLAGSYAGERLWTLLPVSVAMPQPLLCNPAL